MAKFEGQERRMPKIEAALKEYGMTSLEEARDLCLSKGIDVESIVKGVQPIAFENAVWAYTLGAAIALKRASPRPQRQQRPSVSDSRHSAYRARLQKTAR